MKLLGSLRLNFVSITVAAGGLVACGAPSSGEIEDGVGSYEEAWSSVACASATANASFNGGISPATVSPQSYNTCTKSYVVDVTNLSSIYTGAGSSPPLDAHILAKWGDTIPNNQADCENLEGGAIFYKRVNNQWVDQTGQIYQTGQWVSGGVSFCLPPHASYYGVQAGSSYRVAATMRLLSGTNPTRKVSIETRKPVIIP
jgi:hypothetical protein